MIKCANCYFCSTNDIFFGVQYTFFGMQEKKFERAVQTIGAILLPYGTSFAALWHKFCRLNGVLPPYVKFLNRSTKVCCIFLGCVCVCVKASLWIACCCQKLSFTNK